MDTETLSCRSSYYTDTGRRQHPGDREVRCDLAVEHDGDHAEIDEPDGEIIATWPRLASLAIPRLSVWVPGRPAPKGSHKLGEHGQLRDASAYLAAWSGTWAGTGRNRRRMAGAVERAVYTRYAEIGVDPAQLPIFRGPVAVQITFLLDPSRRFDGPPDVDKLERSTWDALTIARVWEDDARVISSAASKAHPTNGETGALIVVWAVTP